MESAARRQTPAAAVDDRLLAEIVRRLVSALNPERIYIFGSRARGDARPNSDYDLLVVVNRREGSGRAAERAAYRALAGMGVSKDVVVMTSEYFDWARQAKASLPATVEREGRLLYAA